MPWARPLTTTAPRSARPRATSRASARPAAVARRLPTIATTGPSAEARERLVDPAGEEEAERRVVQLGEALAGSRGPRASGGRSPRRRGAAPGRARRRPSGPGGPAPDRLRRGAAPARAPRGRIARGARGPPAARAARCRSRPSTCASQARPSGQSGAGRLTPPRRRRPAARGSRAPRPGGRRPPAPRRPGRPPSGPPAGAGREPVPTARGGPRRGRAAPGPARRGPRPCGPRPGPSSALGPACPRARARARAAATRSRTTALGSAGRLPHELVARQARDLDVQVDAIGHRPRQPRAVGLGAAGRAHAPAHRVAVEAAGARVARADQQRAGREAGAHHRPGDVDAALLERLAQRVEHRGREGADLVEEEHAVVGEAHLPGARQPAAAHEPGRRDRVVGRAEGPPRDQRAPGVEQPRHRVDARDGDGLVERQRREDPRQAPGEHGLPGPRGARS